MHEISESKVINLNVKSVVFFMEDFCATLSFASDNTDTPNIVILPLAFITFCKPIFSYIFTFSPPIIFHQFFLSLLTYHIIYESQILHFRRRTLKYSLTFFYNCARYINITR